MTDGQLGLFDEDNGNSGDSSGSAPNSVTEIDSTSVAPLELGRFNYDPRLAHHLYESGLSRGRIRLAADLAGLQPQLDQQQRRALFMLVAVGLEAHGRGSTFVPLVGHDNYFERRIEALIPRQLADSDDRWSPPRLIDACRTLLQRSDMDVLGTPGEFKPLIVEDDRLYHQRILLHETRLVDAVAARLNRPDFSVDADRLQQALDEVRDVQPGADGGEPIRLNAEQQYAMLTALHRPMTLITGGPGTGKTSIVVSILRMFVRLGISPSAIALAAPTGKAANRMAESIIEQLTRLEDPPELDEQLAAKLEAPKTLHRLLGYSPRRDDFRHHPDNPLGARAVIVDEASMIDLLLMQRLMGAVPDAARLILLGDADQLPSVDTGAVLRDLIPQQVSTDAPWRRLVDAELAERTADAPTAGCAVRLQTSYRMRADDPAGRQILEVAQAIRDYDTDETLPQLQEIERPESGEETTGLPDGVRLWRKGQQRASAQISPLVHWWFRHIVLDGRRREMARRFNQVHRLHSNGRLHDESTHRIRRLLAHYRKARILTLTRVFPTGSGQINERLHRAVARLGDRQARQGYDFHPGEPVMMTRNDYDRDLFNGDQGVVVWTERDDAPADTPPVPMAVFERADELVAFRVSQLGEDLEHAFAMTVHKAQGSEFDRVAIVLPDEPMPLLNRELLYTGLTRARRGVLVVGQQQLLDTGAGTQGERFSAVGEKLAAVAVTPDAN